MHFILFLLLLPFLVWIAWKLADWLSRRPVDEQLLVSWWLGRHGP